MNTQHTVYIVAGQTIPAGDVNAGVAATLTEASADSRRRAAFLDTIMTNNCAREAEFRRAVAERLQQLADAEKARPAP